MAIAAGLGWRLMKRPPIASSLIGLGLFSLLRTSARPLDPRTSFLRQSARSLRGQGEDLASAIGETAARAKDTIAEKSAETWDSTKDKIQEWTDQAGGQLVETSSKAKSAGEAILQSARRQQHVLVSVRDEGVGLPAGYDPTTSKRLGSRLTHALAKQLGAELTRPFTAVGTNFTLLFPLVRVSAN